MAPSRGLPDGAVTFFFKTGGVEVAVDVVVVVVAVADEVEVADPDVSTVRPNTINTFWVKFNPLPINFMQTLKNYIHQ